jgi:hypothetical protein
MLVKILLPLLWPLAAVMVQYLKARHRWIWNPISVLEKSSLADQYFEGAEIALNAVLGSAQTTFFVYVAVWSSELFKVWRSYPTSTVLAVIFIAGLLDFSPLRRRPAQS